MNYRYLPAAPLGLLMPSGLLWLMHTLIATAPGALVEPRKRYDLNWVFVKPREVINEHEPEIIKPPPPVQPPTTQRNTSTVDTIDVPIPPPPGPPVDDFEMSFGHTDGPLVNVMDVRPVYPQQAVARGIEGFVTVKFDVTEAGSVTNVRVIESSHSIFERAAREAALRSKFRPRVVDGVAQPTADLVRRYRFSLDE